MMRPRLGELWEWRRSRKLVSWNAREAHPPSAGPAESSVSPYSLVVGLLRQPIDGLSISQTDPT
jgi:hypothetical protein